jgi:putative nucleotidyltransferase with HDIG domain
MSVIQRISIDQLAVGMYVHDINCPWTDHPFISSAFLIRSAKTLAEIRGLGVQDLFIDVTRGSGVVDAVADTLVEKDVEARLIEIASAAEEGAQRVLLDHEIERARQLNKEAGKIVRGLLNDTRLGRQINLEQIDPLVESLVDSIFRNQDALLPLLRLKEHDDYTFQHSVSVCALSIAFARGLKLDRKTIKQIGIGGLLHDVGKAKVPDEILNKPAKLTEAEFSRMRSHVVQSILTLQNTPGISQIALDVAAQHHERFDGTGYPNGLKSEEISLFGRMGAIIDVYDAITSNRVYHKGMTPTAALGRMLEWSGHHFDPQLTRAFIRSIGIYPTGSLVRLASGRLGIVLEQHPDKPTHPKVRIIYHAIHKRYLPSEVLNLAWPGCKDELVGHESFDAHGIDPARWL